MTAVPPTASLLPTPLVHSEVCRWLSKQAEAAGVDILPGYGGKEVLYDWDNRVVGVATGDVGIGKDGKQKEGFVPGVELMAKLTLLAEGCRGSLSEVRGVRGREGLLGMGQKRGTALVAAAPNEPIKEQGPWKHVIKSAGAA